MTVYERADRIGGLLRFGIPDFKLDKSIIDRRVSVMKQEGIIFQTNTSIGQDIKLAKLQLEFDAIVLTTGSTTPRLIEAKGNDAKGIYPAM